LSRLKTCAPAFAAVLAAALGAGGCGVRGDATARVAQGEKVFTENCAICHQADGSGYAQVYPNLAGNPIVRLGDPAPVIETVLHGRGSMPGFAGELSPEQIAEVVTYVRHAWGNDASSVTPGMAR
jgi:mono/diheme cytochrome c family protein